MVNSNNWVREFATNLQRERGFSQESLARKAGVNRSYVINVETGKTCVGFEIIWKFAEV